MSSKKLTVELDKAAVKLLLTALDQYEETLSPVASNRRERFCDVYKKLKITLLELTFMEGSP